MLNKRLLKVGSAPQNTGRRQIITRLSNQQKVGNICAPFCVFAQDRTDRSLCSSITLDEREKMSMQYYIEEPETHLHPGLLSRLIGLLSDTPNIQVFYYYAHSSVVLDAIVKEDAIYQLSQDELGRCKLSKCTNFVQMHEVLDSLGVNGASLLQANCTIWVEGPSDRINIRS